MRKPLIRKDDKRAFVMYFFYPTAVVLLAVFGSLLYSLFTLYSDYAWSFLGTLAMFFICSGAVSSDKA